MRLFSLTALILNILAAAPSMTADEVDLKQASQMIIEKTNAFRKEHDRDPVKINEKLQETAQKFADFMARTGKYGHYADGHSPAERVEAAGYDYCVVRENIAYRTDSEKMDASFLADHFTQGWIDSPHHRENMLADFITDTAVAIATSDGLTYYAVQLFGRPKSMAFRVELTNQSDSPWTIKIQSNGGSDEVDVPPRGSLRMSRCFPVTISIVGTAARETLKAAAQLVIEPGEDGPTLRKPTE